METERVRPGALGVGEVRALLARAPCEHWSGASRDAVEGPERYSRGPDTAGERANAAGVCEMLKTAGRRRERQAALEAPAVPTGSCRLARKPLLFWLLAAVDPVSCVLTNARDDHNLAVHAMLSLKVAELARRVAQTPSSVIVAAGGRLLPRRRPGGADGQCAALERLMSLECDPAGADRWGAVAACSALGAGLVVRTPVFADVVCAGEPVVWVPVGSGACAEPEIVSCGASTARLAGMAQALLGGAAEASMAALREACGCMGAERPLPRSRAGLEACLRERLAGAA